MISNSISPINFTGIVPLKKGQLTLKLTAKDKKQIEELIRRRTELDIGIYSMEKITQNKKISSTTRALYKERISSQKEKIKEIEDAIKQIKIKRFNKQKARAAKKEAKKLDVIA